MPGGSSGSVAAVLPGGGRGGGSGRLRHVTDGGPFAPRGGARVALHARGRARQSRCSTLRSPRARPDARHRRQPGRVAMARGRPASSVITRPRGLPVRGLGRVR